MGRRLTLVLCLLALAAAFASAAHASSSEYAPVRFWQVNIDPRSSSSSYSTNWYYNWMYRSHILGTATVTFIDARSYGWHFTVANSTASIIRLFWDSEKAGTMSRKAYCGITSGSFYGSCVVSS